MALTKGLGLIAVSILTAVLSRILAEEAGAWTPSIVRSLIKFAVGRLPEGRRERFQEEWQSHVNDVPGQIGKLLAAVGFLIAAYKVTLSDWRNRARERDVSLLVQFDEALFNGTTLVNLIQSDEHLASLEVAEQSRLVLSKLRENRDRLANLYAAHPDIQLTLIAKLLHAGTARQYAEISRKAKQIKELNSKTASALQELKRAQSR